MDNIKLSSGEKFMIHKTSFKDADQKDETIRIYSTKNLLDILIDANYQQFFLDGTFRCVPKGSK